MKRRYIALLLTFLFPIGIWLGLEGYELISMLFLITGWAAVIVLAEDERYY